jgi:hypothetical protein
MVQEILKKKWGFVLNDVRSEDLNLFKMEIPKLPLESPGLSSEEIHFSNTYAILTSIRSYDIIMEISYIRIFICGGKKLNVDSKPEDLLLIGFTRPDSDFLETLLQILPNFFGCVLINKGKTTLEMKLDRSKLLRLSATLTKFHYYYGLNFYYEARNNAPEPSLDLRWYGKKFALDGIKGHPYFHGFAVAGAMKDGVLR